MGHCVDVAVSKEPSDYAQVEAEKGQSLPRFLRFLSLETKGVRQFIKYGVAGAAATGVQVICFYLFASLVLRCLTPDDLAVRLFNFPVVEISDTQRAFRYVINTGIAFLVANIFCWVLNRLFVFRSGRHGVFVELILFVGGSALSTGVGALAGWALIQFAGVATSYSVISQVLASVILNFVFRKFIVFRG